MIHDVLRTANPNYSLNEPVTNIRNKLIDHELGLESSVMN